MKRHFFNLALLAVTLMAGAFAGSAVAAPIRLATGADGSFMSLIVAVDQGFMKNQGLDATIKQFPAGGLALESVVAGDSDIALVAELPAIIAAAKGAKVKAVARGVYSNHLIGLAAINGINNAGDLVGKSVGYSKGTASDYYLNRYLDHYGIAREKLKLVNVAPPELVATMARGDIQAMFSWDPWFTRLKAVMPNTKVIGWSGDNGIYTMQFFLMFSDELLNQRPEDARKAFTAIRNATAWLNDRKNRPAAVALMSKAFRISTADAEQMMDSVQFVVDMPPAFPKDMVSIAEWVKQQGTVQPFDPKALIDKLITPVLIDRSNADASSKANSQPKS
ncbi:ABC transporter substrate-binding protein [Paraburkholderia sp. Ac-20336]|uniref:ABC transporter substrate-binding protein n=1 Tax=Paraburkholderia sp. Ac-20336 TaxID=2703886 RepID=UPI0019813624|nr:ABC transporter substrate-binding protein [Paraburkholderia sp. Ac-20336]MBN3803707.1 ABC transporter substrate-binding protein [Paraburkholderia sp. Ac-20336]